MTLYFTGLVKPGALQNGILLYDPTFSNYKSGDGIKLIETVKGFLVDGGYTSQPTSAFLYWSIMVPRDIGIKVDF